MPALKVTPKRISGQIDNYWLEVQLVDKSPIYRHTSDLSDGSWLLNNYPETAAANILFTASGLVKAKCEAKIELLDNDENKVRAATISLMLEKPNDTAQIIF